MKLIINKIIIGLCIIVCTNIASDGKTDNIESLICNDVLKHLVKKYKIHPEDISIIFKRIPVELETNNTFKFRLSPSNKTYKTGYQTIWLEAFKANIFKMKFPVSFEVSISKQVAVSKKRIKRGQKLNNELVQFVKTKLTTNPDILFKSLDNLTMYESSKYIKPNTIITKKMVRIPPALKKGDNVEIEINSGNLSLRTLGIAREDGYIGEEIKVICLDSRKKLNGIVLNSNKILVKNNGY